MKDDQIIRDLLMQGHSLHVIARYCGTTVGRVKQVRRRLLNVESVEKPPRLMRGPRHWYDKVLEVR